jgi:hypothetical protein
MHLKNIRKERNNKTVLTYFFLFLIQLSYACPPNSSIYQARVTQNVKNPMIGTIPKHDGLIGRIAESRSVIESYAPIVTCAWTCKISMIDYFNLQFKWIKNSWIVFVKRQIHSFEKKYKKTTSFKFPKVRNIYVWFVHNSHK